MAPERSVEFCPVPTEQQPLNEYQQLQSSWFYRWATQTPGAYIRKAIWIWGGSWMVFGPVAAASYPPQEDPAHFFLASSGGAGFLLLLVWLRLYLGWKYVRDRLVKSRIEYEESGWYDGQSWTKTPEMQVRDRLLADYQIQPLLRRMHQTFRYWGLLFLAGGIAWNFL
ncbi:CGLD27 family protein [Geitlerinema sp. PCC 9228]|jgi:hypothetical protein|uniref:CGLD27 family protein n=1 Tax=Geitlerinema sp. PCC 9228 TaxID=111611 RepID=UPI0008F9DF61|nr:CGLD27 family protein [Geitlerinema sp. PCC 9228]